MLINVSSTTLTRRAFNLKFNCPLRLSSMSMSSSNNDNVSDILVKINNLVQREALISDKYDVSKKVVDFEHPKDLFQVLPLDIGQKGVSDQELEKISETVVKYSVKTCHPYFYNQLYHGVDEYGLAGSWLSDALNTNIHTFEVAPAFIAIEHHLLGYIKQLFGWKSNEGDGIFNPGGSMSNFYGMMLARHHLFPELKSKGMFGHKPLVAFTSEESHYSIVKGANMLGLGVNNVVKVKTDKGGRMIPEELDKCIQQVISEDRVPFFVNATSGSTVLGAYDDLDKLSDVCRSHKIWLHVDACWGGSVVFSSKLKHLMNGSEKVDSIAWNPHKMVGAPLQSSAFIVRHAGLLHTTNSANATYLFQQDKFYDVSYDTGDKSIQCGRKVDAFKLWFMLKAHGEAYMGDMVENTFNMAEYLVQLVQSREGFRLVPGYEDRQCTNVGFWYVPPSLRNQKENDEWWTKLEAVAPKIKETMIKEGTLMIGYQPLPYKNIKNFFRMVIHGVPRPSKENMDFVINEIERIGKSM